MKVFQKRNLLIFLLILLLCSCGNRNSTGNENIYTAGSSISFDYLPGNWKRSNEKEDRETFEHWTKRSNNEFSGFGYTIQNGDTTWQERIKLIQINNGWEYRVSGQGDGQPTVFRLTKIDEKAFTAENPDNEFPKMIMYQIVGDKLKAVISGGDMEISFEFKRIGN